jgi:hypothetical protein
MGAELAGLAGLAGLALINIRFPSGSERDARRSTPAAGHGARTRSGTPLPPR